MFWYFLLFQGDQIQLIIVSFEMRREEGVLEQDVWFQVKFDIKCKWCGCGLHDITNLVYIRYIFILSKISLMKEVLKQLEILAVRERGAWLSRDTPTPSERAPNILLGEEAVHADVEEWHENYGELINCSQYTRFVVFEWVNLSCKHWFIHYKRSVEAIIENLSSVVAFSILKIFLKDALLVCTNTVGLCQL